jgi:hypothetical protein
MISGPYGPVIKPLYERLEGVVCAVTSRRKVLTMPRPQLLGRILLDKPVAFSCSFTKGLRSPLPLIKLQPPAQAGSGPGAVCLLLLAPCSTY